MTPATSMIVRDLTAAFLVAKRAAEKAGDNEEDSGTCNLDTPIFRVKGVRRAVLEAAAAAAGLRIGEMDWFGERWFFLHTPCAGQASRRARMAEAAEYALRLAADSIPNMSVALWQHAD